MKIYNPIYRKNTEKALKLILGGTAFIVVSYGVARVIPSQSMKVSKTLTSLAIRMLGGITATAMVGKSVEVVLDKEMPMYEIVCMNSQQDVISVQ